MKDVTLHLSDAVKGLDSPHQFREFHMRQAKVVSVQATSVTVNIAGDTTSITGVRWIGTGLPKINGGVVLLDQGGFLVAMPYNDQYQTATTTSISPSLTADTGNPTLGAGSSTAGFYGTTNGKTEGRYAFQWGTAGSLGTGNYKVSVPVTPTLTRSDSNSNYAVGTGHVLKASTGDMLPFTTFIDGSNVLAIVFRFVRDSTTVYLNAGNTTLVPASGDSLVFNFGYW